MNTKDISIGDRIKIDNIELFVSSVQWDWKDNTYAIEGNDQNDKYYYLKWIPRDKITKLYELP